MILTPENRIKDYTEKGWWGSDTLYSLFITACNESGPNEALVDAPNRKEFTTGNPQRLTFDEINRINIKCKRSRKVKLFVVILLVLKS